MDCVREGNLGYALVLVPALMTTQAGFWLNFDFWRRRFIVYTLEIAKTIHFLGFHLKEYFLFFFESFFMIVEKIYI